MPQTSFPAGVPGILGTLVFTPQIPATTAKLLAA
jgi:hypothetical protein